MSLRRRHQLGLGIALSIMLIIIIIPIIWVVLNGFKSNHEIINKPFSLPESWSLQNIVGAWNLGNFGTYFFNSAFITVMTMLIVALVACPAGYVFAKIRFPGNHLLFYLILLGIALPVQSIIISLFYLLKQFQMVDSLWGITLASAGLSLPFSIFLMRNTFKDLPDEIRESSLMDGASEWRTYLQVMLPLAKPGAVAMFVFTFMFVWNDFLLPLVLLNSESKYTLSLGLFFFQGEHATNYALIFGGTLISMVPSIIVYLIFQRQFIDGMAAGSVK